MIYQLNAKTLEISLVKKINVNLKSLIELEKEIYVNETFKYVYIWKKLQSIYKFDILFAIIFYAFLNNFMIIKDIQKY